MKDIAAVCVQTATYHVCVSGSALFYFSLISLTLTLSSMNAGGGRDVGVGSTLGTRVTWDTRQS